MQWEKRLRLRSRKMAVLNDWVEKTYWICHKRGCCTVRSVLFLQETETTWKSPEALLVESLAQGVLGFRLDVMPLLFKWKKLYGEVILVILDARHFYFFPRFMEFEFTRTIQCDNSNDYSMSIWNRIKRGQSVTTPFCLGSCLEA